MANKFIPTTTLKHYYNEALAESDNSMCIEPDKSKSISQLSQRELNRMMSRLSSEREIQQLIKELKRNSGEKETFEEPFKINTITPIEQLYHHGILGQKWGVRRFQNVDGTRTSTGKKRDRRENRQTNQRSEDHMQSRISKSKGSKGLSNAELRKVNERLQLEETYKKLTADDMKQSQSWVKKSLATAGEQALTEFSKGVILGSAKLLVKELSPQLANAAFNVKEKKN